LDWAGERAAKGFAGATVACEPTGHRWRILGQLAGQRSMPFVCVQPSMTAWARRSEDLTFDKTDEKDAVLIARLTAQLQQMRALLECVWPASLDTAKYPFRSRTWAAAMSVVCERDGGDLARTQRLGTARFERAVRREITKRGGQKPSLRIVGNLFTVLAGPAGKLAHRPGALEHAPREKLSGTFVGRTKLTGQGRPGLRLAAWRAVWGALQTNTVYAARYRHLAGREDNKLTPTQAQTVIAATILRHCTP
jgi:hypothetical protein